LIVGSPSSSVLQERPVPGGADVLAAKKVYCGGS
jgi:hypothetical protein